MEDEQLDSARVHRGLDRKVKLLGFEIFDLLFVLIFASVMNLIFGRTALAPYVVIGLPVLALAVLFISKSGKPPGYLTHLFRYLITPGLFSAGQRAQKRREMLRKISLREEEEVDDEN